MCSFWSEAILLPLQRSEDAEDDFNTVVSGDRRRNRVFPWVCSKENQDSFHSWLYFARIHLPDTYNSGKLFPEPSNININMMPFIVGPTFEDCRHVSAPRPVSLLCSGCRRPSCPTGPSYGPASHRRSAEISGGSGPSQCDDQDLMIILIQSVSGGR